MYNKSLFEQMDKKRVNRTRQYEASIHKLSKHENTLLLQCHYSDLYNIRKFATQHGVWLTDTSLIINQESERLLKHNIKDHIRSTADDYYDERFKLKQIFRNPDNFERRPQTFARLVNIAPLIALWIFNNKRLLPLARIIALYAA